MKLIKKIDARKGDKFIIKLNREEAEKICEYLGSRIRLEKMAPTTFLFWDHLDDLIEE